MSNKKNLEEISSQVMGLRVLKGEEVQCDCGKCNTIEAVFFELHHDGIEHVFGMEPEMAAKFAMEIVIESSKFEKRN